MRNRDFDRSPMGRRQFIENNEEHGPGSHRGPRHGRNGHHGGMHGDGERGPSFRGRRGRRGAVRLAVLALLSERPMHGYEMMQELSERTQGMWRPSPGSLYPALQLLEDQGLVKSLTNDGRRQFTLTDEGRAELAKQPATKAPWETLMNGADQDVALRLAMRHVMTAVRQVAEAGTADQKVRAEKLITELRRQMYLLLAEETPPTS